MSGHIVDASVLVKLLAREHDSALVRAAVARASEIWAPEIVFAQAYNALETLATRRLSRRATRTRACDPAGPGHPSRIGRVASAKGGNDQSPVRSRFMTASTSHLPIASRRRSLPPTSVCTVRRSPLGRSGFHRFEQRRSWLLVYEQIIGASGGRVYGGREGRAGTCEGADRCDAEGDREAGGQVSPAI